MLQIFSLIIFKSIMDVQCCEKDIKNFIKEIKKWQLISFILSYKLDNIILTNPLDCNIQINFKNKHNRKSHYRPFKILLLDNIER